MGNAVQAEFKNPIDIFKYNAMTYNSIGNFGIQFLGDMKEKYHKDLDLDKLKKEIRQDDECLYRQIVKTLKKGRGYMTHKILVIDEIDNFASQEKAFFNFVKFITENK